MVYIFLSFGCLFCETLFSPVLPFVVAVENKFLYISQLHPDALRSVLGVSCFLPFFFFLSILVNSLSILKKNAEIFLSHHFFLSLTSIKQQFIITYLQPNLSFKYISDILVPVQI